MFSPQRCHGELPAAERIVYENARPTFGACISYGETLNAND